MEQEQSALPRRNMLIENIIIDLNEMEVEELEAIYKYCGNYHHVYQKPGEKYIITEITIEPMKTMKEDKIHPKT